MIVTPREARDNSYCRNKLLDKLQTPVNMRDSLLYDISGELANEITKTTSNSILSLEEDIWNSFIALRKESKPSIYHFEVTDNTKKTCRAM